MAGGGAGHGQTLLLDLRHCHFSLDRRSSGHLAHDKERQRARTVRTSVCFIHDHKTSSYQNNDVVQAPSFTAVLFAKPARRPLIPRTCPYCSLLPLTLTFTRMSSSSSRHRLIHLWVVLLIGTSYSGSSGECISE